MTIFSMKQGSSEWFQARAGSCTGSHAADILAMLKNGKGEQKCRADYRLKLATEILTGIPQMDGYLSPAMEWGTEQEPFARAAYEMRTGAVVDAVGFVTHPTIARMGGSPDGLIGEDGGIEIKCPQSITHLRWMLDGQVPDDHQPQMFFYMAVTGRKWIDFVSFDPRLPEPLQMFVERLERDETRIAEIEAAVVAFNAEVDGVIGQLKLIAGVQEFVLPAQMAAKVAEADDLAITDVDIEAGEARLRR